jgi:hypothetical protein
MYVYLYFILSEKRQLHSDKRLLKTKWQYAQLNDLQLQGRICPQNSGIFCFILTVNTNYYYKNQRILVAEIYFLTGIKLILVRSKT